MAAQGLASQVGVAPACRALGVSRATFYRRHKATPGHQQPRPTPARALCESEREHVLARARLPSLRRPQRPPRSSPRCSMKANICARSARCIGSWPRINRCESGAISSNILATPSPSWWPPGRTRRGPGTSLDCSDRHAVSYFYLYVLLDIFSRYVVGWMVAERENAARRRNAHRADLPQARHRAPGPHPALRPRGAHDQQMHRATARRPRGDSLALSRPHVSDDNPFSEAQFKTLKYHPGFPGRFDDIHAAIAFCRSFFPWYNTERRHGGIAMLTPDDVHHGRAHTVLQQREQTLRAAWSHHPERFVRGIPETPAASRSGWINPPAKSTTGETAQ